MVALIDFDPLIKGKELQCPGTNFTDTTLKLVLKPHSWSYPTSGTKFVPGLGALSP